MPYDTPIQRAAFFNGIRLGTELMTIIPEMASAGKSVESDIDQDMAHVSVLSRGFYFKWLVKSYLTAQNAGAETPQIGLHYAFMDEMLNLLACGKNLADLAWVDDISRKTVVTATGPRTGPQTNLTVGLTNKTALNVSVGDYVVILKESAKRGFVAQVKGGLATTIVIDVPGPVLIGNYVQADARQLDDGDDVYFVHMGYQNCRYGGQALPDVAEGSQDSERFNMTYEFYSNVEPVRSA